MPDKFNENAAAINQLENFTKFIRTWAFERYIRLPHKIIGLFTGNQSMKTASTAYQYVMRIMGTHPVAKRNVLYLECSERAKLATITADVIKYREAILKFFELHKNKDSATWGPFTYPQDMVCPECGSPIILHKRKSKIFRFASESLPTEKETLGGDTQQSAEISNTQYPEFKRWLPPFLIKKEISIRRPALTLYDPLSGMVFANGETHTGSDIVVEFQSYNQEIQAGAGVQRLSCWCDEEPPFLFFEEQFPRLLVEDGDIIVTVTPANKMTWTYDDLFEKARLYIRTPAIREYYEKYENREMPIYEVTDSDRDIAVIQAATDDNPTLPIDEIEESYKNTPDPDDTIIPTRRYGIFTQATGRIFKDFRYPIHVIDLNKYGINAETMQDWTKAHSFDFHQSNAHAIIWVTVSPTNEVFIYDEWNPSPSLLVMSKICDEIAYRSGFNKFVCSLIDPLAKVTNTNTGKSTVEEMNIQFNKMKLDGICGRIYFEPYATRGEVGRDAIKERLQNAVKCERPFNNTVIIDGAKSHLPTMWISKNCRQMIDSVRHWRLESWVSNKQLTVRDKKEKPAEKWSHFCTALEGLFKDKRVKPRKSINYSRNEYSRFKGR